MEFLKNLGLAAGNCASRLKDKNNRIALINRLRTVIRCEEKAAEKEYLALGRYYYNALRDRENAVAEEHCLRIEEIEARRDSVLEQLQAQTNPAEIEMVGSVDGPTAVFITERKRPVFHFDKGPVEITITRDKDFDPTDETHEEVDLSDVESFDYDPIPQAGPIPAPITQPAEPDENDSLPFEG